jgi:hypothetical protein
MNNNNNNRQGLSMENIPGTPPPKKQLKEEVNYETYLNDTSDGLINPFRASIPKFSIFL